MATRGFLRPIVAQLAPGRRFAAPSGRRRASQVDVDIHCTVNCKLYPLTKDLLIITKDLIFSRYRQVGVIYFELNLQLKKVSEYVLLYSKIKFQV